MRQTGTSLLVGAILAFIASLSMHGLAVLSATPPELPTALQTGSDLIAPLAAETPIDLVDILLVPGSIVSGTLLLVAGSALAYHALRRWDEDAAPHHRRSGIFTRHRAEGRLVQHAPLILGLLAGAVWPWLETSRPLAALVLAGIMAAGLVLAALAGVRQEGRLRKSTALCFAAGWATLAASAMLVSLLEHGLGVPPLLAACLGLSLAAILTVSVQLRLGRVISYSVAVIWGLIAIIAGAMLGNAGVATLAVLAIAVIAFGLVQVST